MLFQNSARSIATVTIISIATPPFVALVIPLGFLYLYIQRYYLRTSRELKRLDSVSRSPIYAHFQESLGGISTIRAYQQQSRFIDENEWRVDANLRAYFPSINANRCAPFTLPSKILEISITNVSSQVVGCSTGVYWIDNHSWGCRLLRRCGCKWKRAFCRSGWTYPFLRPAGEFRTSSKKSSSVAM